ncbi:hypothetical protein BCR39DRAFT_537093 [Naematelia encephala]|uniref:Uncharacterized protein n=1 Tax=Naematelia encephala TaxID=71784 RepID=A0A1Y2AZ78_9TREE|nr:hypothetical protein BCR39DRAFT_537093 [Naematelia encephala]
MEFTNRDMAQTPDAAQSVRSTTPPPLPTNPDSGLIFHPPTDLLPSSLSPPRVLEPLIIPIPPVAASTGEALEAKPSWFGRRGSVFTSGASKMPAQGTGPPADIEMGSILAESAMINKQRNVQAEGSTGKPSEDRTREEMAMAKWRKWIIEQPVQPVSVDFPPNGPNPQIFPMTPLSRPASPLVTLQTLQSSTLANHRSGDSSPTDIREGNNTPDQPDFVQNTESVRALRDVELAIDTAILNRAKLDQDRARRMSTNARLSTLENPFIDLAARLTSRRVRPIVLELIQALGHYIDIIWTINFPDAPCPWTQREAGPSRRHPLETGWKSRMITAVQASKATGHVDSKPADADLKFWEDEVVFGVRDTNEVVGICKGVGWGFKTAMIQGRYGDVDPDNVIGSDGTGGNYARLLNDLEEVLWGDAEPRPTDLAPDLPDDFDPYAIPDPEHRPTGVGSSMMDFFVMPQVSSAPNLGSVDEYHVPLPDLLLEPPTSLTASQGLTLEEIGRRRHEEWLQSRRAEDWAGLHIS